MPRSQSGAFGATPHRKRHQRRLSELEVFVLAGQNVPHHKPAKDCRFSESSVWGSELDSNCRYGYSRASSIRKLRTRRQQLADGADTPAKLTCSPPAPAKKQIMSSRSLGAPVESIEANVYMLRLAGIPRVLLATDATHMTRATRSFKRHRFTSIARAWTRSPANSVSAGALLYSPNRSSLLRWPSCGVRSWRA